MKKIDRFNNETMLVDDDELRERYDNDEFACGKRRRAVEIDRREKGALNVGSQYDRLGKGEASRGASALCLGNYTAARGAFVEGAAFKSAFLYLVVNAYRQGKKFGTAWNAYPHKTETALQIAVLGSDSAIETRIVDLARLYREEDVTKPYFKYWRHRLHSLAALVDRRPELAKDHLEEADAAAQHDAIRETNDPPTRILLRGLLEADKSAIVEAVSDLAELREQSFEYPPAHGLQLVSLPAVAGIALARRRGLDVSVDSDAVPPVVNERDWAHRDHELSDLARETLADVDAHDLPP